MRKCPPVAIVICGWLLMYPPTIKGPDGQALLDTSAPITKWDQRSAHDTAQDCERAKQEYGALMTDTARSYKDPKDRLFMGEAANAARCAPADHIYPQKRAEK